MYRTTTRSIQVTVIPLYLEEQSDPAENRYIWAYQVSLENKGRETVQLLTRYWNITDANGKVLEVRGDGVVGEQPILHPNEMFEYTSGTPLSTPSGIMVGSYQMKTSEGVTFDVAIPAFSLDCPYDQRQVH
jgi:ApaG protein